ncbi:MAG: hypothetical protein Q4D98_08545, partial [Planctomycetia bacterium]|nr:hypothetical protein [Planctomycetia bacterium]
LSRNPPRQNQGFVQRFLNEENIRLARDVLKREAVPRSQRIQQNYQLERAYYSRLLGYWQIRDLVFLYLKEIERIARYACENDLWHLHLRELRKVFVKNTFHITGGSYKIHIASREEKIQIILSARVRKGRPKPYVLCTAFRCSPQEAEKAFLEYLDDRKLRKAMSLRSQMEVLAIHRSGKEPCHD